MAGKTFAVAPSPRLIWVTTFKRCFKSIIEREKKTHLKKYDEKKKEARKKEEHRINSWREMEVATKMERK